MSLEQDLEAALERAPLVRRLKADAAKAVVSMARRKFVEGAPRAWWMSLRQPFLEHPYPHGDALAHLVEHSPSGDCRCWLILETEDDQEPVLELQLSQVQSILKELQYIEFYVVENQLSWMMAESDHNVLYVSRDAQ